LAAKTFVSKTPVNEKFKTGILPDFLFSVKDLPAFPLVFIIKKSLAISF
jgi:hypothetical protein